MTRESIRPWCINFSDQFANGLRHLDELHVDVGGSSHWVWRAVDEHGVVLDVFLQRYCSTEAARAFFGRLVVEHGVPVTLPTDKLWSCGAALRTLPVLHAVEHVQDVSTALRGNTLIEPSHHLTRRQEQQQRCFRARGRAQGFLDLHARITTLHHPAWCSAPARHRQKRAFKLWREVVTQVA